VSHGGVMAKGGGLLKKGEAGHGLSSRWYPKTLVSRIGHINSLQERFSFSEANGLNFLKDFSDLRCGENPAFFIDPPYSKAGRRLYDHHDVNHAELFRIASTLPGKLLMTYDDSDYIKRLAKENGFLVRGILMRSVHHVEKYELLISKDFVWLDNE
jgi:DNA adenine methylase